MSEGAPTDPLETRTAEPLATSDGPHASDTLADAERIEAASMIGRFTILDIVGAGGMGQVYAAYDPQLDRRVALKVLHTPDDEVARQRLVREAQALARLSHPNVVGVHEVGAHEGRVFVAMEFVEGETLKDWARTHAPGDPDRLRRALELLLHAGRGLAAAHDAGLVHRDVKPGNILVGRDGRVRVADFGLARADHDAPPAGSLEHSLSSSQTESGLGGAALTRTGMIAGTPAYMAPEQLTAEPIGPATDQFGFCVTAWEVLFGHRPFPLGAIIALLEAIRDGKLQRPESIDVPAEVEAALRKGLAYRPKRRHASIDALLHVFEDALRRIDGDRVPVRARRGWIVGAVLGGLALGAGVYAMQSEGPSCARDTEAFDGVWDDARHRSIESTVLATDAAFAPEAWSRLAPALDAWRSEWLEAHVDACEATHVRGEQSSELLDLRMACLHDRRMHFAAFLDVLAEGDIDALAHADEGFAELPRIARCADSRYVRANVEIPTDAIAEARAGAIAAELSRLAAVQGAGRPDLALAPARAVVAAAEDLGYDAQLAHARLRLGSVLQDLRQHEDARVELESAYLHARRARLPEVSAECGRLLALLNGVSLLRFSEGRWWLRLARLEGEAVPDAPESVKIDLVESALLRSEGRLSKAAEGYEETLNRLRTLSGERHPTFARTLRVYGELELVRGRHEDGCRDVRTARSLQTNLVGQSHPSLASFYLSEAICTRLGGDIEAANAQTALALAITDATFGPDHVALTPVLDGLAGVLSVRGDGRTAIEMLDRALALRIPQPQSALTVAHLLSHQGSILLDEQDPHRAAEVYRRAYDLNRSALGDHHPTTARARIDLGTTLGVLGQDDQAIAWIQAGLAVDQAILGSEHPDVAVVHDVLASEMQRRGEMNAALDHAQRAFDIFRRAYGPEAHTLIKPHGNLCNILSAVGRTKDAVSHCERALELARRAVGADEAVIAALHNSLGSALFSAGRLDDALSHYEDALELWRKSAGGDDFRIALALANIAEIHLARDEPREALDLYTRSMSLRVALVGSEHPALIVPLVGSANAELELGRTADALLLARRAHKICTGVAIVSPATCANAEAALAKALWSTKGGRKEATRLIRSASRKLESAGVAGSADLVRVRAWMESKGIADETSLSPTSAAAPR